MRSLFQPIATPYLLDLLTDVRRGNFATTPGRPYAWDADDVLAFWESVATGMTTGGYLVWARGTAFPEVPTRTRIGPVPVTPRPDASVLLDGHCRLATLAWSLRIPGDAMPDASDLSGIEAATWGDGRVLATDLRDRAIRFASDADLAARPHHLMPIGCLTSTVRFAKWTNAARGHLADDDLDWVDGLGVTLRGSVIALSTLVTSDPEVVSAATRRHAESGVPRRGDAPGPTRPPAARAIIEASPHEGE